MATQQNWSIETKNNNYFLMSGEIDYVVTPKIRKKLLSLIQESNANVTFDLSKLSYLDSSGLAIFIEIRRKLLDKNVSVSIVNPSPEVSKIFKLTQVAKLFGIE